MSASGESSPRLAALEEFAQCRAAHRGEVGDNRGDVLVALGGRRDLAQRAAQYVVLKTAKLSERNEVR